MGWVGHAGYGLEGGIRDACVGAGGRGGRDLGCLVIVMGKGEGEMGHRDQEKRIEKKFSLR